MHAYTGKLCCTSLMWPVSTQGAYQLRILYNGLVQFTDRTHSVTSIGTEVLACRTLSKHLFSLSEYDFAQCINNNEHEQLLTAIVKALPQQS